jgi:hypothetical protein
VFETAKALKALCQLFGLPIINRIASKGAISRNATHPGH